MLIRRFFDSESSIAAELKQAIERLLERRSKAVEAAGGWGLIKASLPSSEEEEEPEPRLPGAPRAGRGKKAPPNPFAASPLATKDDYTIPRRPEDIEALPGSKTQRRISHEFYKLRELELRERASRLDRTDPRRLALHNSDRFSRQVFTALPDNHFRPTNEIYRTAAATCLGLPLTLAMGSAGRNVDKYGFSLSNNATANTRHTIHNKLRDTIIFYMRLGCTTVSREPKDLLVSAQGGRSIIPDIAFAKSASPHFGKETLFDIKTLGGGTKEYTGNYSGPLLKGAAVRAGKVPGQYLSKARKIDREDDPNLGPSQSAIGPLERILRSHGGAVGLCFGFYAEASPEVHRLVKVLAEKWVEQSSVEAFDFMGNKKQAEARVARIIRRNWGLTCAFSWASHKISALHRLNSRSAGLIQIAEEMEYDQQIDDNPAVLYDQAGSEEEC